MPIYEYECDGDQKHRFETWQSIKADPLTECPTCGSPVHKILHPAGIIFKGSGWYITDSRKGSGDNSESKNTSKTSPGGDSKTSEAKSESSSSSGNGKLASSTGDSS